MMIAKKVGLLFLFALCLLFSFFMGSQYGVRSIEYSYNDMQGELAFHHLDQYKRVYSDLSHGCNDIALEKLDYYTDMQIALLADFIRQGKQKELEDYVKLRSPETLKKVYAYDFNKSQSHTFDICEPKGD